MGSNGVLATISQARSLLATATLPQARELRDKAEAVRSYMKMAGESLSAQNHAAEIKLRAERRIGELLAGMEKAKGGRGKTASTMEALSINHKQSHRWQRVAAIPEKEFESHVESIKAAEQELTQQSCLRLYAALNKTTKSSAEENEDGEIPLGDALELLSRALLSVWLKWPKDCADAFARKLHLIAEEVEVHGGMRE